MRAMEHLRGCVGWGLAGLAILLSPVALIFAIPLFVGFGLDVFELGQWPVALAFCVPLALALLHRTPHPPIAAFGRSRRRRRGARGSR
jgi:hypothetical protein